MLQLHDLSKLNSMIAFDFNNNMERLKKIMHDEIKKRNKYHFVILDTVTDYTSNYRTDNIIIERMK